MKQAIRVLVCVLAVATTGSAAQTIDEIFQPFGELLERRLVDIPVERGRLTAFDYEAALEDPETAELLAGQAERLRTYDIAGLATRERAVAFWINAYNYFMIAHVLRQARQDGELVDSVRDFGSFFNPNAVFKRERFEVGGRRYSLDDIEKGILLGDDYRDRGWLDPRVHFAVNCASVGCPPLRGRPYTADRLDAQLDDNTRSSLANELHLRIDGETVHWSSLFDWYEDDFEIGYDSVRDFIAAHVPPERARSVRDARRVEVIDYDWRLNRPSNFEAFESRRSGGRPDF